MAKFAVFHTRDHLSMGSITVNNYVSANIGGFDGTNNKQAFRVQKLKGTIAAWDFTASRGPAHIYLEMKNHSQADQEVEDEIEGDNLFQGDVNSDSNMENMYLEQIGSINYLETEEEFDIDISPKWTIPVGGEASIGVYNDDLASSLTQARINAHLKWHGVWLDEF